MEKDKEAKVKEGGKQGGGDGEEADRGRGGGGAVRRCGDWSGRLKLLRYESRGNRVVLTFSSDYAHGYSGFRARVTALPGKSLGWEWDSANRKRIGGQGRREEAADSRLIRRDRNRTLGGQEQGDIWKDRRSRLGKVKSMRERVRERIERVG